MKFAYIAAFATAVCFGVSAVIEDRSAKRTPLTGRSGKRAAVRAALRPLYLAGMALSVLAWVLSLIALRRLPLFAVQSIAAGSIGVVVLIGWKLTGERPSRRETTLLVVLGIGLVLMAISAAPSDPRKTAWPFAVAIWAGVLVTALAAWRGAGVTGTRGAAILGAVSGLADGGLALCARSIHNASPGHFVSDPFAIALIPFAVIGVVAFAGALQRGSASVALATQQAVTTVVPSAIGLAVLGDRARSGFDLVTALGFVATIVAVITLTLTHPVDQAVAA